jgi:hypothetical protein
MEVDTPRGRCPALKMASPTKAEAFTRLVAAIVMVAIASVAEPNCASAGRRDAPIERCQTLMHIEDVTAAIEGGAGLALTHSAVRPILFANVLQERSQRIVHRGI